MTVSRKDFEMVAKNIKNARNETARIFYNGDDYYDYIAIKHTLDYLVGLLVVDFKISNRRFDAQKFIDASLA